MSAADARTGPHEPAIVRVQQDARDRDDRLAAAVLSLWDLLKRALDMGGEEVNDLEPIAALREQLAATGRRQWADEKRAEIDAAHLAARRQSGVPATKRYDGSRAALLDDENDLVASRQRLLAKGQAARHAQMAAAGGYIGDASDAHKNTRPIREQLYQKMQDGGQQ